MGQDLTTSNNSRRIIAFDLLRGYFIFMILVDHVGRFPSFYDLVTGRGQMWVSAAEGFFFMSGLLVSVTKARRIKTNGMRFAWTSIWKRAAYLYVLSVILTLTFTAWAYAEINNPGIKGGLLTETSTWGIIKDTFLLRYTYGWTDFLTHYAVFMFYAPFALYALHKGKGWLVVAASLLIWYFRGSDFSRAWQILFFSGMVTGYYLPAAQQAFHSLPSKIRATALTLVGSTVMISMYFSAQTVYGAWPHPHYAIQPYFFRDSMEIGRIVLFWLCFIILYWTVRTFEKPITKWLGWFLLPFGQNSLYVYVLHAFLVFALDLLLPKSQHMLLNFSIVSAVLAIAWLGIRYKVLSKYLH